MTSEIMAVENNTRSKNAQGADEETPLLRDEPPTSSIAGAEAEGSSEQTVVAKELSPARLWLTLGSIYVGVFLGALDGTVIATLSASISNSFDSLSLLSWLASAYLIANAAFQPISGRLTDIFGRGTGLVFSNVLFATGNLLCGLAKSPWAMISGRAVAGVGGGGLMAIATFVASDLVPLRKRGFVQGVGNVCFGAGAGLGSIYGGWVSDVWGWRAAFYSQVLPTIASAVLVFFLVKVPPKQSDKSRHSRVDFPGAISLLITLILFLLGLNSGGNVVPWNHPLVYVSLPLSLVGLIAFCYIEARIAPVPVIPVKLLLNGTVAATCLTNWFSTMVMYSVIFYVPIFYQVKGLSATQAGIRLIPQSLGVSIGSLGSGVIMNYTGKYKVLGLISSLGFTVAVGLVATLNFSTPNSPIFLYLMLSGMSIGTLITVTLLATISAVSHEHQAVITSATYAFRSTGSSIGIAISSAVYQNILTSSLHSKFDGLPGANEIIRKIRSSLEELKHLPPGWTSGVFESYEWALRGVFLTSFGIAFLSFICTMFIRENKLHRSIARDD